MFMTILYRRCDARVRWASAASPCALGSNTGCIMNSCVWLYAYPVAVDLSISVVMLKLKYNLTENGEK